MLRAMNDLERRRAELLAYRVSPSTKLILCTRGTSSETGRHALCAVEISVSFKSREALNRPCFHIRSCIAKLGISPLELLRDNVLLPAAGTSCT